MRAERVLPRGMETKVSIKQSDVDRNHNPDGGIKYRWPVKATAQDEAKSKNRGHKHKTLVAEGPVDMSVAHYHRRRD